MDKEMFVYEMKKAGYKTPESRAEAIGVNSISAYYRRMNGECEFSQTEICKVSDILGWEKAKAIFFG